MHHETPRKLVHLSGLLFVFAAQFLNRNLVLIIFFSIASFFLVYAEYVRRTKPALGFMNFVFKFEKRKGRSFSGAFWFYMGSGIAFLVFPKAVASAASAILAAGDSSSTIVGINFGKHKIFGEKTV